MAVYPVGLGSSDAPVNVRVVDLDAPRRVYPGDKFAVTAVLQASGPRPIEVEVQLLDGLDTESARRRHRATADRTSGRGDRSARRCVVANDGTLTAIRFELEPDSVGRRRLGGSRRRRRPKIATKRDDLRDARYEVVSRKLRVMAIAGGPTREYRFVRNLLYP